VSVWGVFLLIMWRIVKERQLLNGILPLLWSVTLSAVVFLSEGGCGFSDYLCFRVFGFCWSSCFRAAYWLLFEQVARDWSFVWLDFLAFSKFPLIRILSQCELISLLQFWFVLVCYGCRWISSTGSLASLVKFPLSKVAGYLVLQCWGLVVLEIDIFLI